MSYKGYNLTNLKRMLLKQEEHLKEINKYVLMLEEKEQNDLRLNPDLLLKEDALNDFLNNLSKAVLKNDNQMLYWVKATGKSREELERLKNEKVACY